MSYNNLGTKGIQKLAAATDACVQLRALNVAGVYHSIKIFFIFIVLFYIGNELTATDINILLSKLEVND